MIALLLLLGLSILLLHFPLRSINQAFLFMFNKSLSLTGAIALLDLILMLTFKARVYGENDNCYH